MFEINNLRILNDYLNQTIDVLVRTQRLAVHGGIAAAGLSHSPYANTSAFGAVPALAGLGMDPTYGGLSHSPYAAIAQTYGTPFGVPTAGVPFNAFAQQTYPTVVDPFIAQRGLSHTPFATPWLGGVNEIARQQQFAQAALARQNVLEAMARGWV